MARVLASEDDVQTAGEIGVALSGDGRDGLRAAAIALEKGLPQSLSQELRVLALHDSGGEEQHPAFEQARPAPPPCP